jgi:hypothetical protein
MGPNLQCPFQRNPTEYQLSSCPFLSKVAACRSASLCPTKQTQMDSGTRVKQKQSFFIMLIMLHFCSVFQLEYCTGTSQLSVVKLTLTLYFAQCISFSRLKALNILNFSCLPNASLLSTLRVPGAWYLHRVLGLV